MKHPIVNEAGYKKIWCPLCQQVIDWPGYGKIVSIWWGPPETGRAAVCLYAVCNTCADTTTKLPQRLQQKSMNLVEQRLLEKYPQLSKKLPPGYLASNPVKQ